jgi:hypothetical protein
VNRKAEGRHRVEEVPLDDTGLALPASTDQVPLTPITPDLPGRFSVQLLDDHWFIGPPGAVQRIEDAQWLDNWLAANGFNGPDALDFAGDHDLEQRFRTELATGLDPIPANETTGETT